MFHKHHVLLVLGIFFFFGCSLGFTAPADAAVTSGSSGNLVANLQQALTAAGFSTGGIDGVFGPLTLDALLQFQHTHGINADGIAGPETAKALNVSSETFAPKNGQVIWVTATAYCPCSRCNYPYGGKPSFSGLPLAHGIVAIDPSVISMGSTLSIPGYGNGIAADTGNAIKGNHIDLCFATHDEALAWGVREIPITVYPK